MASIFFLTRGHEDHLRKFVEQMKSQWFPMPFKWPATSPLGDKIEVNEMKNIEAQMRPIQLWEYVIPEEYVAPVCANLRIPTDETWFDHAPEKGGTSFISGFGVKGILEGMRLALGAEKLPKIDIEKPMWRQPIYKEHVNILGIGWRKDVKGEIKKDLKQEKI